MLKYGLRENAMRLGSKKEGRKGGREEGKEGMKERRRGGREGRKAGRETKGTQIDFLLLEQEPAGKSPHGRAAAGRSVWASDFRVPTNPLPQDLAWPFPLLFLLTTSSY